MTGTTHRMLHTS